MDYRKTARITYVSLNPNNKKKRGAFVARHRLFVYQVNVTTFDIFAIIATLTRSFALFLHKKELLPQAIALYISIRHSYFYLCGEADYE